ncbi:MAG: RidA family protein [Dehalococcoidia bacterium]|nr:RidA family protein [Dehalococcoidia bacterium]
METRSINPWTWQDHLGFVQANEVSGAQKLLLCSGQTSVDADGKPVHAGDMAAQAVQTVDNLETVLKQAGLSLANVVRLNYYVTDVDAALPALGAIGPRIAAAGCRPASTLLGVTRLAFPELMIEIEAMAVA